MSAFATQLNIGVASAVVVGAAAVVLVQRRTRRPGRHSRCRHRLVGERGAVTPFVVAFVVPIAMMAGLAFDGGRVLTERRAVLDVAQNAAFAGAQGADGAGIRRGEASVSPSQVRAAVDAYLDSQGYTGTVEVSGTTVSVTVTSTVDMQVLSAVGVGAKTVTGQASARLVRGVEGADT